MRNELERMQRIEQYLSGGMSAGERQAFEQQMAANPALREAVGLQRDLMQGAGRAARRQLVRTAGRRYRLRRNSLHWGLGAGVPALLLLGFLFVRSMKQQAPDNPLTAVFKEFGLPELNEEGKADWVAADSLLQAQLFDLDATRDTVIETRGGLVLSIPASGFLDEAGKPASGTVQLCVKEALDAAAILQAGLSTGTGDGLLETAGMFYLDARQGSRILRIDSLNSPVAVMPAANRKAGMMAFKGRRDGDRGITWTNPVPLPRDLIPVDIRKLDFYPPGYLDLLRSGGYAAGNKRFTDSVYYALSSLYSRAGTTGSDSVTTDGAPFRLVPELISTPGDCGINPAGIKTIWNSRYARTLLSTKEFEERLKLIHKTHQQQLLELYVKGLDRNLYELDSAAARLVSAVPRSRFATGMQDSFIRQFAAFARRRDGRVAGGNRKYEQLSRYFDEKTRLYTEAYAKTSRQLEQQQQAELERIAQKRSKHREDTAAFMEAAVIQNFTEEYELNLDTAYKQLGKPRPVPPATDRYTINVNSTGWWNVDRYVYEATANRTSMTYTDPGSGRVASIQYEPVSIAVDGAADFDRLMVYLIPDKLSAFMRMYGAEGVYTERLNRLIRYDLVCVAVREGQRYYYSQAGIAPGNYTGIRLRTVSNGELDSELKRLRSLQDAGFLRREAEFAIWDAVRRRTATLRKKWSETFDGIVSLIYPCETSTDAEDINVSGDYEYQQRK